MRQMLKWTLGADEVLRKSKVGEDGLITDAGAKYVSIDGGDFEAATLAVQRIFGRSGPEPWIESPGDGGNVLVTCGDGHRAFRTGMEPRPGQEDYEIKAYVPMKVLCRARRLLDNDAVLRIDAKKGIGQISSSAHFTARSVELEKRCRAFIVEWLYEMDNAGQSMREYEHLFDKWEKKAEEWAGCEFNGKEFAKPLGEVMARNEDSNPVWVEFSEGGIWTKMRPDTPMFQDVKNPVRFGGGARLIYADAWYLHSFVYNRERVEVRIGLDENDPIVFTDPENGGMYILMGLKR